MPGVVVHETKELDNEGSDAWMLTSMELDNDGSDAWMLTSMELGNDPDAMEPDTGSEVLCHNLLAKALLS
jgi:hypothetical protein